MLKDDFFKILDLSEEDTKITANIRLDANHQIFEGHFPQSPVTPGVTQIQMVKEILEQHHSKTLQLQEMGRCKFLKVMDPVQTPEVRIVIEQKPSEEGIRVSALGEDDEGGFFKFNATFA